MTYRDENEFDDEPEVDEAPPRRRALAIIAFIILALAGTGAGFAWHAYGGTMSTMPSLAFDKVKPVAENVVPPTAIDDYRQKTAADLQSKSKLIEAQQAQIKTLTDTVAQLTGKIEALERQAAELSQAQAAAPKVPPKPKPKPKPQPAPAISTGGAPLPTAPEAKR